MISAECNHALVRMDTMAWHFAKDPAKLLLAGKIAVAVGFVASLLLPGNLVPLFAAACKPFVL